MGQLKSLMQFLEQIEISTTNIRQPNTVCYGYTVDNVAASWIVCYIFKSQKLLILVTGLGAAAPRSGGTRMREPSGEEGDVHLS